jgi:hypothetical protein
MCGIDEKNITFYIESAFKNIIGRAIWMLCVDGNTANIKITEWK